MLRKLFKITRTISKNKKPIYLFSNDPIISPKAFEFGDEKDLFIDTEHISFGEDETNISQTDNSEDVSPGSFENFHLLPATKKHLRSIGYNELFPVQQETFTAAFSGENIVAKDRTGSGKTLAFTLPLLEKLRRDKTMDIDGDNKGPKVLIMTPTRELATQVTNEVVKLMNRKNEFRVACLYGGVSIMGQQRELQRGVDIVVGTPGRLLDLQSRKDLRFKNLQAVVLDETDAMLDIGFQKEIERILEDVESDLEIAGRKPADLQYLLFSATVPEWVKKIAQQIIGQHTFINMIKHNENKTSTTVEHLKILTNKFSDKVSKIGMLLKEYVPDNGRCIIFTETKKNAADLFNLIRNIQSADVLTGDVNQAQRSRIYEKFKSGQLQVLIATDVAARGLDFPSVDLVVSLYPPRDTNTYIHRSGRTGRAGKKGVSILLYEKEDEFSMKKIFSSIGVEMKEKECTINEETERSSLEQIVQNLKESISPYQPVISEYLKELEDESEKEKLLKLGLAYILETTKGISKKSVISNDKFKHAFLLKLPGGMTKQSDIKNELQEVLGEDLFNGLSAFNISENKKYMSFDIYARKVNKILRCLQDSQFNEITPVKALSELEKLGIFYTRKEEKQVFKGRREEEVCIFVNHLTTDISEEDIENYFYENGVDVANVIRRVDKQKPSKIFVMIYVKDSKNAERAMSLRKKEINGVNFFLRLK